MQSESSTGWEPTHHRNVGETMSHRSPPVERQGFWWYPWRPTSATPAMTSCRCEGWPSQGGCEHRLADTNIWLSFVTLPKYSTKITASLFFSIQAQESSWGSSRYLVKGKQQGSFSFLSAFTSLFPSKASTGLCLSFHKSVLVINRKYEPQDCRKLYNVPFIAKVNCENIF